MAEKLIEEETEKTLWVLVRLKESICAVDGACVEAILEQEDGIIRLPSGDGIHIGMIAFRGSFVPVTDLRVLMGIQSQRQEQDDFEQMLEQRKQDHKNWVMELERSLAAGDPFLLATDPHKCAFGKWYDSYQPTDHAVAAHLQKIDAPHKMLHQTALEAAACPQDGEHGTREECMRMFADKASNEYMPAVVQLLEEAKQIFHDSYRQMMVVLTRGEESCALLVDEVLAAEALPTMAESRQMSGAEENPLVTHIAQRESGDQQILILNQDRLFSPAPAF